MPFDLSTAKPVDAPQSGGFDLASAKPVGAPEKPAAPKKEEPKYSLPENLLGGVLEPLAAMGSGAIAKPVSEVAGMAALGREALPGAPGGDPKAFQQDVQKSLTYEPKTPFGQSQINPLNFIPQLLGKIIGWGGEKAGEIVAPPGSGPVRTAIGKGVTEGVEQIPNVLGAKGGKMAEAKIPGKQAALDVEKSLAAPKDELRDTARGSGYITPPEGGIQAAASGLAGPARNEKIISQKNNENASRRFAKEVGIADDVPLTKENIEARIQEAYEGRRNMEQAIGPNLQMTPQSTAVKVLQDTLAQIESSLEHNREVNRPLVPAQRIIKTYLKKMEPREVPAGKIVDERGQPLTPARTEPVDARMKTSEVSHDISSLRKQASKDFRDGSVEIAHARLGIANQLENLFEENLAQTGQQALVDQFKADRVLQAKLHFIERVTNPETGLVDLAKVRTLSKTKAYQNALTGEFRTAADFADTWKKGAQTPTGEAAPRLTVFDGMFAVSSLAAGHPWAAAAELGGRLGIPALAERGLLQNKPPSYRAGTALPKALPALGIGVGSQIPQPPQ